MIAAGDALTIFHRGERAAADRHEDAIQVLSRLDYHFTEAQVILTPQKLCPYSFSLCVIMAIKDRFQETLRN